MSAAIKVGVIRGGPSSEYEVSLRTGQAVLANLVEPYEPFDILITRDCRWHFRGIERAPDETLRNVDVVVNALHGEYGEDGKIQRLLEHHSIPYTGSDALASALAMSKVSAKEILSRFGVKIPRYVIAEAKRPISGEVAMIFQSFSPPYIVKPMNLGSSVGVRMAKDLPALETVLGEELRGASRLLVEEYIFGKEVTCGVISSFRGVSIYSLPPVEILLPKGSVFFDYEAKYSGKTREICPGRFSRAEKEELQRLAGLIHAALGLRHYSRSDFILHPKRGAYFLEVNTLPGLTEQSLLPLSLCAVGSNLSKFLEHIITLALERK